MRSPTEYNLTRRLREGRTNGTDLRWSVTDIHREAADTIERLIRERDEAREELARMTSLSRMLEMAKVVGDAYRCGVEEAVAAGDKMAKEGTYGWVWLRSAILALLEQTSDTNSPHLETGAVPKSET